MEGVSPKNVIEKARGLKKNLFIFYFLMKTLNAVSSYNMLTQFFSPNTLSVFLVCRASNDRRVP